MWVFVIRSCVCINADIKVQSLDSLRVCCPISLWLDLSNSNHKEQMYDTSFHQDYGSYVKYFEPCELKNTDLSTQNIFYDIVQSQLYECAFIYFSTLVGNCICCFVCFCSQFALCWCDKSGILNEFQFKLKYEIYILYKAKSPKLFYLNFQEIQTLITFPNVPKAHLPMKTDYKIDANASIINSQIM